MGIKFSWWSGKNKQPEAQQDIMQMVESQLGNLNVNIPEFQATTELPLSDRATYLGGFANLNAPQEGTITVDLDGIGFKPSNPAQPELVIPYDGIQDMKSAITSQTVSTIATSFGFGKKAVNVQPREPQGTDECNMVIDYSHEGATYGVSFRAPSRVAGAITNGIISYKGKLKLEQGEVKTCPYCAETIKAAAIKCRYCGSDLTQPPPAQQGGPPSAQP